MVAGAEAGRQPGRGTAQAVRRKTARSRLKCSMTIAQIAGILPALIFPTATLIQLVRMMRARSAAGVSVTSWLLFGVANIAIYIYAERYTEWQAIVGMLVTAVLDFIIVALAFLWRSAPAANDGMAATVLAKREPLRA